MDFSVLAFQVCAERVDNKLRPLAGPAAAAAARIS